MILSMKVSKLKSPTVPNVHSSRAHASPKLLLQSVQALNVVDYASQEVFSLQYEAVL